ncbi:AraC family transcriptional regulator [Prolixibacteraceae bacterium Z1-6]|uniref:AraC family transcriptional regulator n=1 Tax=Draconibacterium aestuarii TaxID=2998507 RepID=A0A9X3F4J2_9BACT|nr:AraC family transcriptional regulator [Prolixibacteraceae bacterium Z1-6]
MLEKIPIYELPFKGNEKLEFKIYRVKGVEIQRKDYPHKTELPHKHNYFEVCFFTGGSGKHEIDFKTHKIKAPSIHFLRPGQVHVIYREKEYRGYLLVFSEEFFNLNFQNLEVIPGYPLITQLENGPILNLGQVQYDEFNQLIQSVITELKSRDDDSDEIIVSFLKIFFLKLRQNFSKLVTTKNETTSSMRALVYRFNQLVEENYSQIHHVKEYAEVLGESPINLNRAIKSVTEKTASEIIIDRLMLEAKRLLIYSNLSNKEVAYKLNYEDPSYFTRIFRKKTGLTPSAFRTQMSEQYR